MSTTIIAHRRKKLNEIMSEIANFNKGDLEILLKLLRKKGTTYQEIADAMGVSKQSIQDRFPFILKI